MEAWHKIGMERLRQIEGLRDDIPLIPAPDDFYKAQETVSRAIIRAHGLEKGNKK
jgi:hypothetical protein